MLEEKHAFINLAAQNLRASLWTNIDPIWSRVPWFWTTLQFAKLLEGEDISIRSRDLQTSLISKTYSPPVVTKMLFSVLPLAPCFHPHRRHLWQTWQWNWGVNGPGFTVSYLRKATTVMFSISWCYLTPLNSRQSNRFLVTVVHRGTCEGDFAEKTPTNQQWGQQTVAEKGNFTQKKKVCWVSLHLTWKKHTHVNSKKKALQVNRDPRCFGNAPPPEKSLQTSILI